MEYKLPSLRNAARRSGKDEIDRNLFALDDEYKTLGKGKAFYIITHGCQANVRDSETIAGILSDMGFSQAEDKLDADIIFINTCAIRQNAEEKVFGELGFLLNWKRKKENAIIALCGCMAQEEDSVQRVLNKYPHVDLIFGTHNIYRLPELLRRCINEKERVVEIFSLQGKIVENLPSKRDYYHKAWVNIMYGCDKFCSYCIVPYTRGKERSRSISDILDEVNELVEAGYQEICLLGQNVNAYGLDINLDHGFATLLEEVAKTGIERVRFMTPHPRNFDQECVDVLGKYDNLMPGIHLPVQSGSNRVLRAMARSYSREEYLDLFYRLKKSVKNATFTTDIIVGFPNETDDEFQETLSLVDECQYSNAFTFIYSPRIGTPAAKMKDSIPMEVKEARLQELNKKIAQYAKEDNLRYQDKIVTVLCDGYSKRNENVYAGYTPENKLVNFKADKCNIGDLVKVKIEECKSFSLNGSLIEISKAFPYNN